MITTRGSVISLTAILILIFGADLPLRAQTDNPLQPVPLSDTPEGAAFFKLSDYLANGGILGAPYPFNPNTNSALYSLNGTSFLVDEASLTNDDDLANALSLLVQPTDGFSRRMMSADSLSPPGDGGGDTNSSGGWTNGGQSTLLIIDTNSLWLEIVSVTNSTGTFVIHPPQSETNFSYDLFLTTNLTTGVPGLNATNWLFVLRTSGGQTNVIVPGLTNDACFFLVAETNDSDADGLSDTMERLVTHSNPTNADTDGDGLPDGWEWWNFGNFNQTTDGDFDQDGIANYFEYNLYHSDPNTISFSSHLNQNVNVSSPTGSVIVASGVPSNFAVLVDSTNWNAAVWQSFASTNIVANLGTNQGWHEVWIGLKGRAPTSQATWHWNRVNLDAALPSLVFTSPTNLAQPFVVAQSILELQGYCVKPLSQIYYDLTNASGSFSNLPISVLNQFYDTNICAYTTNTFQAFDIMLANGTNLVTVHAFDLAGNGTTTNLTFNLDYSSKTNPPSVNLLWPQNGYQVSDSNFTWRGWIDDISASVSVSLVATNGKISVYPGVVERDGTFWVQNLPLNAVTNILQLTVTDGGGRTSQTNISVIKSSIGFSVTGCYSHMPVQNQTSVYGTISTNTYSVWVNGVQATITGNHWTATNVPVTPGGMYVFQATAIPNSDNGGNGTSSGGSGAQSQSASNPPQNPSSPNGLSSSYSQPKQSGVYIDMYRYSNSGSLYDVGHYRQDVTASDGTPVSSRETHSHTDFTCNWDMFGVGSWLRTTITDYSNNGATPGISFDTDNVFWPHPTAASYYQWYNNPGTYNHIWTNGIMGTTNLNGVAGDAPEAAFFCHMKGVTDSDVSYQQGGNTVHEIQHTDFHRDIESTMKMFVGGLAVPGSSGLFVIVTSVGEELFKGPKDDSLNRSDNQWNYARPRLGVANYSVGSLGTPAANSQIYVALAAGSTVDVTPHANVDYGEFSVTGSPVNLQSVTFSAANGYHDVISEYVDAELNRGFPFPKPHWTATNQSPVLFVAGSRMVATTVLTGIWAPANTLVTVKGVANNGLTFWGTNKLTGGTFTTTNVATAPLASNKVDCFDPLVIHWSFAFSNSPSFKSVGDTANRVYVSLKEPTAPVLSDTLLYIACNSAKGLADTNAIVNAIWSTFQTLNIKSKIDGQVLTYWYTPESGDFGSDTFDLLLHKDGSCGGFADMFGDAIAIHGIPGVVQWGIRPPSGYVEIGINPNLPAQGMPTPMTHFVDHQVVQWNGMYYDPSYGKSYTNQLQWEDTAVSSFYTSYPNGQTNDVKGLLQTRWSSL